MKNLFVITEGEKNRILQLHKQQFSQNFINEQKSEWKYGDTGDFVKLIQKTLIDNLKYDLGPKKDDGIFGRRTRDAVKDYQKKNNLIPNGIVTTELLSKMRMYQGKPFGQNFNSQLKPDIKQKSPQVSDKKNIKKIDDKSKINTGLNEVSSQVNKQLDYMKNEGLLKDESFTILDDKNSKVHTFNPNYQLVKTYYVITGKDFGDKIVKNDFYQKLWNSAKEDVKKLFSFSYSNFFGEMKKCIDGGYKSGDWGITNQTPSGIFKRTEGLIDYLEDELVRLREESIYGKKYISFEDFNGDEINTAFHGTQNPERIKILTADDIKKQNCRKRKMSKGCVNFKESDVLEINKFIKPGQKSIWLPSDGNNIVKIPEEVASPGFLKQLMDLPGRIF